MKIIKPQNLSLLTRCFETRQEYHLGVAVIAYVPIGVKPGLLSEVEMWNTLPEELGAQGVLDLGIPKSRSEFLVSGSAFAPGGGPVSYTQVSVQIEGLRKTLHVAGDRYWIGERASDPQAFTQLPLSWDRAYGGETYAKNPLGKGMTPVNLHGHQVHPLPNISDPNEVIYSPSQRPNPAGFGPYDFSWPQRSCMAGSYDENWVKTVFPGFPADLNWCIFNCAPQDQWLKEFWKGNENYCLQNMHPERPELLGRLPGIATRCFVHRANRTDLNQAEIGQAGTNQTGTNQADSSLQEVATRLTTVWFFPHLERLALIYHGSIRIRSDDASDLDFIVAAADWAQKLRPVSHYEKVFRERIDPEVKPAVLLRDSDLSPEGLESSSDATIAKGLQSEVSKIEEKLHQQMQRAQDEQREQLKKQGLNPDDHLPDLAEKLKLPVFPTSLDQIDSFFDEIEKQSEQQRVEAEKKSAKSLEQMQEDIQKNQKAGATVPTSPKFDPQDIQGPTGPPKFSAAQQLAEMEQMVERGRKQGTPMEGLEAMLHQPNYREQLIKAEEGARDAYRQMAHEQNPSKRMKDRVTMRARREIQTVLRNGQSLAGRDFSGIDLSGMDLSGKDFRGAWLEAANFEQCKLNQTRFDEAVLAHANFIDCEMHGCNLTGANLGKATIRNTRGEGVLAREAILSGAKWKKVDFSEIDLGGADLHGVEFEDVVLRKAKARELLFIEATLRRICFDGADLSEANFLQLCLEECSLNDCNLQKVTFVAVTAEGLALNRANLSQARMVDHCRMPRIQAVESCLSGANLRDAVFEQGNFSRAVFDDADLSAANMRKVNLTEASMLRTLSVATDFEGARMVAVNGMDAVLQKAVLYQADLRGTNLFASDLSLTRKDAQTRWEDANVERARIYPVFRERG